ncbi:MAG: diguanylate cyclase [Clostridia bacterium]|nr:diguanylate cyclase [Clostridia bacterium]
MNGRKTGAGPGDWFTLVQQAVRLGCWELDLADNRLSWSDGMYALYGLDPAGGIPGPEVWKAILCPPDPSDTAGGIPMGERIAKALRGEAPYVDDFRILRQDTGEVRNIHTVGEVVTDSRGNPVRLIGIVQDVTEFRAREEAVRDEGYRDPLTGLFNRRFFEEELRRIDTPRQRPISLVVGDVQALRMVNDIHGFQAGDRLLSEAAEMLKSACRAEDIVARWGGDEFVVCLPRTDAGTAERILERIAALVEKRAGQTDSQHPFPLLSLGAATRADDTEPLRQLIRNAEDDLERRRQLERMNTCETMIRSTADALRRKGIESPAHTGRIEMICRRMGERLGLGPQPLDELGLLARLHDIGLITVGDDLLSRPGPLTSGEWAVVRRHPETGSRIVRSSHAHAGIAGLVLAHHERWDGGGYPNGLSGEDIPLQARIFAIADTFAAMTESRPYRKTPGAAAAREEIRRQAGAQFDPALVRLFLEMPDVESSEG